MSDETVLCSHCGGLGVPSAMQPAFCTECVYAMLQGRGDERKDCEIPSYEQEAEPVLGYCDYCGQLPCECLTPTDVCPLCCHRFDECDCDFEVYNPNPVLPGKRVFVRGFAFGHWRTHNRKRLAYSRYPRKYHPAKSLLAARGEARQLHKHEGWVASLAEIERLIEFASAWDFDAGLDKYHAESNCPF